MAGTAEKKKLEQLLAITRRLDHLTAITRVHLRIGTTFESKRTSRIYLRELIDMVGCDGCAIIQIDKDKVRILAERGLGETFRDMEFSADQPALKYVVDTKQAIFTGDVPSSSDASYVPHGRSVQSLICTPIVVNNDVGGIIYLDSVKKIWNSLSCWPRRYLLLLIYVLLLSSLLNIVVSGISSQVMN